MQSGFKTILNKISWRVRPTIHTTMLKGRHLARGLLFALWGFGYTSCFRRVSQGRCCSCSFTWSYCTLPCWNAGSSWGGAHHWRGKLLPGEVTMVRVDYNIILSICSRGLDGSTISFPKVLNILFNCIRLLIGRGPKVLSTTSLVSSNNFRYILRKILKILFNSVPIYFCLRTQCKVYMGLNPDVLIQGPTLQVRFSGMILTRIIDPRSFESRCVKWIHSGQQFSGCFDVPWSEWSWIADAGLDHPKE